MHASSADAIHILAVDAERHNASVPLCVQADHAAQVQAARSAEREATLAGAARERDAQVAAAVASARKEAEREKRAALRETAAEAEKALRRVMEAAAQQQAKAVAAARRQFEEELLQSP